jgi:hypothetical protein
MAALWRRKMFLKRPLIICLLVTLLYLAFPPFAYAYLDPGTGSYVFQLLIAGAVGLGFLVKVYWSRIKLFFTRLFSKGETMDGQTDGDSGDE